MISKQSSKFPLSVSVCVFTSVKFVTCCAHCLLHVKLLLRHPFVRRHFMCYIWTPFPGPSKVSLDQGALHYVCPFSEWLHPTGCDGRPRMQPESFPTLACREGLSLPFREWITTAGMTDTAMPCCKWDFITQIPSHNRNLTNSKIVEAYSV